jgi:hypothetical protein
MGEVMNDLFEFIEDLEAVAANRVDIDQVIAEYKAKIDQFELDMEAEQQRDLFYS